ncbi:hypothetical protein [Calidifontibacillus oryziterrae]|uniref:hypothetical protein n=1 Tax=Calidifontibacillus oryziterrae TaxID=1191699 RepID=UPI0002EF4F5A|nr:hypothetical protein [Calidifontibacillus oryziterrae]
MNKPLLLILLLLFSGCALNTNEQGQQPYDLDDFQNSNVTTSETTLLEGEMTDIADLNPNFLDLNTENEAHNNHGYYQDKAREIVKNSTLFEPGMIFVNGENMVVNVTPKKKLSKKDLGRYRNGLHDKIMEAVPRYNIDVIVNER